MKILVTGGGGQVGTELRRLTWPDGVIVHAPGRAELDVTDEAAVASLVGAGGWSAVINAAAFTAVDLAETEASAAWRLNALAPALLAQATAKAGIPLVHISTDYVFDGLSPIPYSEDARVAPLGVYGASKEGGEQAVRTGNARHAIVRTSWVVSAHRTNFVKTMLRLARERDVLRVVDDQVGRPTSACDLAIVLAAIAVRLVQDPDAPTGTYHAVNAGDTSWFGFAREIMAQSALRGARSVPVEPIPSSAFPTPASRPANSRLSTEKLQTDFGVALRPWSHALSDILDELVGPLTHKEEIL